MFYYCVVLICNVFPEMIKIFTFIEPEYHNRVLSGPTLEFIQYSAPCILCLSYIRLHAMKRKYSICESHLNQENVDKCNCAVSSAHGTLPCFDSYTVNFVCDSDQWCSVRCYISSFMKN
jgi:hypothetical protein